jgi:zinc D-Ala-D-Ala carboxypeptidase
MKHFTLDELTHSQAATRRGLKNDPDTAARENLQHLVDAVLDPLREALGRPVVISSGYRSPAVNRAVGGAASSQHVLGQAADITVPGMTVAQVVATIRRLGLPFDQLIDEFGSWVHVSHSPRNRRQVLRAKRTAAGTKYEVIP